MFRSKNEVMRGALFSLLAFVTWSCGDTLIKLAGQGGLPVFAIVFFTSLSGASAIFGYSLMGGKIRDLKPKRWKNLRLIVFAFLANAVFAISSFTNLPLTTVYAGIFLSPFIIAIYAALFMGEPLGRRKGLAITGGFLGVLVALFPRLSDVSAWNESRMIGFVSLFIFIATFVTIAILQRKLKEKEKPKCVVFFSMATRLLVFMPVLFVYPVFSYNPVSVLCALGVGVCGAVGFLFSTHAYRLAPAAIVAPFHYVQLLTGALFGYFVFGEQPTIWLAAGGALIILSGLMIAREAGRREKPAPQLVAP